MLSPVWVERALRELPEEILASRPEQLYLEDFATIANIPRLPRVVLIHDHYISAAQNPVCTRVICDAMERMGEGPA
jgi:hypothetical protein